MNTIGYIIFVVICMCLYEPMMEKLHKLLFKLFEPKIEEYCKDKPYLVINRDRCEVWDLRNPNMRD